MASKIYKAEFRRDYIVDVTFFDGRIVRLELEELANYYKELRLIMYNNLFKQVAVNKSRTSIVWPGGVKMSGVAVAAEGRIVERITIRDPKVRFAEKLRSYRECMGITQKELESRTGIHQSDISKIERGESNVSLDIMDKLTTSLGFNLQFFATDRDERRRPDIAIDPELAFYLPEDKVQGEFTLYDIENLPEGLLVQMIDGVVYREGIPVTVHERIISTISYDFMRYIHDNKGSCEVFLGRTGVISDRKNFVLPDMLVSCDRNKVDADGIVHEPDFVLEVVSPGNSKRDYSEKLIIYTKAGVKEYWVIDPYKRCLVVYDLANDGFPEIHPLTDTVGVKIYEGKLKIDLKQIAVINQI